LAVAKLIVNPTSSSRREIPLARTLISIGRDPSNDLVLPDAMVSRRHAVIEYRGSQYFLRDCNSSNGSLVNGDRVSERTLRDGDLVAIGTARLLFREDVDVEDAGAKVVQHPSAPKLNCPACQADYRKGDLFCRNCGGPLAPAPPSKVVCTSCGTAVPLPARFCNACGHALGREAGMGGPPGAAEARALPDNLEITKPRKVEQPPHPDPAPEPDPGPGPREAPPPPEAPPEVPPIEVRGVTRGGGEAPAPAEAPEPPPAPPAAPPLRDSAEPAAPAPEARREGPRAVPPRIGTPAPGRSAAPAVPPLAAPRPASRPVRVEAPERAPERPPEAARPAGPVPAGFGSRLAAGLIDAVIVSAGQLVLMAPVLYYWQTHQLPANPSEVTYWPILLSLFLVPIVMALGCVYYVYYWGVKGATPGKRLLGLVVEHEDGRGPIGIGWATVRVLCYMLSGLILGIGFLMIAFGGQGLHDRLARTRVMRGRG
jgi:uncharacterized RDD family membrane protein YckC